MSFPQAVRSGLAHCATFQGRAGRSAFWWWVLVALLALGPARRLDGWVSVSQTPTTAIAWGAGPIAAVVSFALLQPTWAVTVRRLRDTARSGW
jgi:uncharacterized membrane protein YhaH (DUF805 family)